MASKISNKTPQKKAGSCLSEIERLRKQRESRRRAAADARKERAAEEKRLTDMGMPGDVDFQRMIDDWRDQNAGSVEEHTPPGDLKICICVRKRPVSSKEIKKRDFDSVTCLNPRVTVHDCKTKVDGITKFLDNTEFAFDHTFDESSPTEDLYVYTTQPLVEFIFRRGRATVFAYGQTGSGKTFTMAGIQELASQDIFSLKEQLPNQGSGISVHISFFEIYGGRCQDLLNHRQRLEVREDGKGEVVVTGLEEIEVRSSENLMEMIQLGNNNRTTHATEANDVSSRSHAICQITLYSNDMKVHGKLSLIDLAGSERAADTKSNNRQRRMEGAEINKSLLSLKECIRALDSNSAHVPYRASKLTLVLKDSFTRSNAKTVMIATVSPTASSADHTLNTLRYADRVKEKDASQPALPPPPRSSDEESRPVLPPRRVGSRSSADEVSNPNPTPVPRTGAAAAAPPVSRRAEIAYDDKYADDDIAEEEPGEVQGAESDIKFLAESYRSETAESEEVLALHRTVHSLFEEEEALLNMHMNVIQENAELLTEEGKLLQQIQGENVVDYDIDTYATRLEEILKRKHSLITMLQDQLATFRSHLAEEEVHSHRISSMPQY